MSGAGAKGGPAAGRSKPEAIRSISFGERPGPEPYNASELVAVGDARFLFCDNNIGTALYELRLAPDGSMACPLVARPIDGLAKRAVDDLEGLALVEYRRRQYIFATPSMSLKIRNPRAKKRSRRGKAAPARYGLVRILVEGSERLLGELIPDFRSWLVERSPELGKSPRYVPDDGGLNVEGLGWDPGEQALLFGVRTPVVDGRPLVFRARLRSVRGPWGLDNFEILPPVTLDVEDCGHEQGVRCIEWDPVRETFLVVVGNSTSRSKAPFSLYAWDGRPHGTVRRFRDVRFKKRMKVEGITHGTVGGRGAVVFVDDGGGYQVLWDDDPRLRL